MQENQLLNEIRLYAEEINAAILLHEELEKKPKNEITKKELEYTKKELLKASYKLQKTLQKIEIKDMP